VRLREAVVAAHRLVRARLPTLSADAPAGLRVAIEAAAKRSKLAVRVTGRGEAGPEVATLAARIVAEAVANADAHAGAKSVEIRFAAGDERLDVSVADDGSGFDPVTAPGVEDGHLGLTVMRERARGHGGECTITSSPDSGTLVKLWIPL
jgi:signal transduction histidine kinase